MERSGYYTQIERGKPSGESLNNTGQLEGTSACARDFLEDNRERATDRPRLSARAYTISWKPTALIIDDQQPLAREGLRPMTDKAIHTK